MNDSWKQEIFKRLDALATKLGVASQYLFGLFVRQSFIAGIECLVGSILSAVLAVFLYKKIPAWREWENEPRTDRMATPFAIIGIPMAFIVFVVCFINSIDYLGNPQYWAFKNLLDTIKNQ